jgi:hypothetical protein
MSDRVDTGMWVWLISAGAPLLGAVAAIRIATSEARLAHALIAAGAMALLSFVVVPTRSGVRMTPVISVIAALPFIRSASGAQLFDVATGLAVVAMGTGAVWVVRTARGDDAGGVLLDSARSLVAGSLYLIVFDLLGPGFLAPMAENGSGWLTDWWQAATLLAVVPVWFMVEAFVMSASAGWPQLRRGSLELRDFDVHLTLIATGALFGLTYEIISWLALVIAGLPFFFALGAFRRLAETRRTYAQTVRALAQIPEAAGHVHPGHALRVAELAGAVSRRMKLSPTNVEEVEWAAYLHDIGRISLNDPAVIRIGYTEVDIAEWGSVIAEEATLDDVATVIRRQHEPYRRPGQLPDPELPVASRIIKVCSAYDELVAEHGMSALEALEQLHRGSVYDYDPDIVAALRSILDSTDALTPRH